MSVVLIGYRGCGKSTVGRIVADRLWQTFIDTDEQIVARAQKSIAQIFQDQGEPHFRDLESQVIAEVAKLQEHVIALGGGALQRQENRDVLRQGKHALIYLRCEPEELHRRIHSDPATQSTRPSLTALAGGIEEIQQLLAVREPIYRQVMHAELDVTHLTADEAATRLVRLL